MHKIALEACKQSLRSRVVEVGPVLTFEQAVEEAAGYPCPLFLYEKENKRSLSALLRSGGAGPSFGFHRSPDSAVRNGAAGRPMRHTV